MWTTRRFGAVSFGLCNMLLNSKSLHKELSLSHSSIHSTLAMENYIKDALTKVLKIMMTTLCVIDFECISYLYRSTNLPIYFSSPISVLNRCKREDNANRSYWFADT